MSTPSGDVELIIPMIPEMELTASKTAEAVGHLMRFDPDRVNEIKLALVEACINAFEHSGSTDRRVSIHFALEADAVTISITDRGCGFAIGQVKEKVDARRRAGKRTRGWGLKIMEELMDEVRVESGDRGTTITMVKRREGSSPGAASIDAESHRTRSTVAIGN